MILRVMGAGMIGLGLVAATSAAAGAATVLAVCALRRRAKARADWPEESLPPPPDGPEA